jgi:hypothetical protein
MAHSRFAFLVFAVMFTAASVFEQSTFGTIIGVIRDQSESLVPGIQLIVTNCVETLDAGRGSRWVRRNLQIIYGFPIQSLCFPCSNAPDEARGSLLRCCAETSNPALWMPPKSPNLPALKPRRTAHTQLVRAEAMTNFVNN